MQKSPAYTLINLAFTSLVLLLSSCNKPSKNEITIGSKHTIHSAILKEDRTLWVHVPEVGEHDTTAKFPVLYLLDGDAHFYSVVGMIHQLSSVNGNDVCPKMVVVGIPNTDRIRDLTPTHVDAPGADSSYFKTSGGGEAFTEFLTKEVIPYIEKQYPVSKQRMLVGHSLGGLMVINTLLRHPEVFDQYVAIDPSLWWDSHKPLQEYQRALTTNDLSKKSLFIAIANTIEMDTARAMLDTLEKTDHFRSIVQLTKTLRTSSSGLDWSFQYYGDEGHSSVPLIAEYDALHFLFRKIPITLDLAALKIFEGRYKHQFTEGVDSFIEIRATKNGLVLHDEKYKENVNFKPLSPLDFYSFDSHFPLRFIRSNNGEVNEAIAFNSDVWTRVKEERQ